MPSMNCALALARRPILCGRLTLSIVNHGEIGPADGASMPT